MSLLNIDIYITDAFSGRPDINGCSCCIHLRKTWKHSVTQLREGNNGALYLFSETLATNNRTWTVRYSNPSWLFNDTKRSFSDLTDCNPITKDSHRLYICSTWRPAPLCSGINSHISKGIRIREKKTNLSAGDRQPYPERHAAARRYYDYIRPIRAMSVKMMTLGAMLIIRQADARLV